MGALGRSVGTVRSWQRVDSEQPPGWGTSAGFCPSTVEVGNFSDSRWRLDILWQDCFNYSWSCNILYKLKNNLICSTKTFAGVLRGISLNLYVNLEELTSSLC